MQDFTGASKNIPGQETGVAEGDRSYMRLHGARISDNGWHIIPIASAKKFPGDYSRGEWRPLQGWHNYAQVKAHPAMVGIWENWPGCGIGIVCGGLTNVIAIDIDILDGAWAQWVRGQIEQKLGVTPLVRIGMPPKVLLVYRSASPMEKISLAPIEVLANGQQFVAYGTHPKTGFDYQWLDANPTDTMLEAVPVVEPAVVLAAVTEAYNALPSELKPARLKEDTGEHTTGSTEPATIEAIREALQHLPNEDVQWDEWKRVLMATFACSVGSAEAYEAFCQWSAKSAKHNAQRTYGEWNACRFSPPKKLGFGTLQFLAQKAGWKPSPGLTFNKNVADAIGDDFVGLDLPAPEVNRSNPATSGNVIPFGSPTDRPGQPTASHGSETTHTHKVTVQRLLRIEWEGASSEPLKRSYLVKKLLPEQGVALLSGASGAGKSFVGIDLAGSLATSRPFFGHKVKPGGTLILASEAFITLNDRLLAYRRGVYDTDYFFAAVATPNIVYNKNFPIGITPLANLSIGNLGQVIQEAREFDQICREQFGVPLRLIIIDTFAAAFALQDENSSVEVTAAMKLMAELSEQLGILVMPVVHHGKSHEAGVRGSSAFEASADARLTVSYTKDDDGQVQWRQISLGKSRMEETGWTTGFELEPIVLGTDEDGDDIVSCVIKPVSISKRKKDGEPSPQEQALLADLERLAGEGAADQDRWIDRSVLQAAFFSNPNMSDGSDDARRKRFARALKGLKLAGLIETLESNKERKVRILVVAPPQLASLGTTPNVDGEAA